MKELNPAFFARDAQQVAILLLGKVLHHKFQGMNLYAQIIETEAYYQKEKGSHASLGRTPKREALFMPPGTIYMYYARGLDSLNFSCQGEGNAVLVKSGIVYPLESISSEWQRMICFMKRTNPVTGSGQQRPIAKLCSGQTLLCRSLALRVADWNQTMLGQGNLTLLDVEDTPQQQIIQTTRLGIPSGRDEHLLYRFIDPRYAQFCTENPLTRKKGKNSYCLVQPTNVIL